MPTLGVVEPLNVVKDVCTGVVSGFVPGAEHSFNLQHGEEALHHRVDAPMSSRQCRIFQIGEDKWVKLANDVEL